MGRLGSTNRQVCAIFLESGIFTPCASKHEAKALARAAGADNWHDMGKRLNVYSYSTAEAYKDVWHQAARWVKAEYGVHDVTRIEGRQLGAWLRHKIDDGGINRGTFRQYAAALEKFAVAIGRCRGRAVDFSSDLAEARRYAANVLPSHRVYRNYQKPQAVISALSDPQHRLAATIQLETGARIDEVRQIRTERVLEGGVLVSGKGGYERFLALSPQTLSGLRDHLAANYGRYCLNYDEYLNDIRAACNAVHETYSGSHTFRHCYAQASFARHLTDGQTYNEALKCVAEELGHHRASITKTYL